MSSGNSGNVSNDQLVLISLIPWFVIMSHSPVNHSFSIRSVTFERDFELENQMIERCKIATEYYKERINKLKKK